LARDLIEADANLDAKAYNGNTALILACSHGHSNVARVLVEKGAAVGAQNNDGKTALDFATANGLSGVFSDELNDTSFDQITKKRRVQSNINLLKGVSRVFSGEDARTV